MEEEKMDLGKGKVGRLLAKFAVPCVVSMLVASLYNIVDQIYIGHISGWDDAANQAISVLCNGATNVVYPFTLIALAICLLFGDGAAALFSLSLGKKEQDKANKSIGNGLVMQIISLIIVTIIGFTFIDKILNLFGATSGNFAYAKQYFSIILIGIPFYMFGQGLNSSIRADGSPKYAMAATTTGAILNIILDPIFIFTLDLGIKGAAWATITGQCVTALLTLIYLFRSKNFKITKQSVKLDWKMVRTVASLGISSLITQISIVIIITVANNLVNVINDPIYGVDIPLAVIGIVMKVFGIVISTCIGIALGGQPIVGYNYGAGNMDRVKKTYKDILCACAVVGIVATLIFQFAPDLIINLFGSGNTTEYIQYARYCIRIYLGAILLTCLTRATAIFLQSCGSSMKSMIVAVSRDVVFFVPSILIIGLATKSVVSMLWSSIITDVLSFILAVILVKTELNKMTRFCEEKVETTGNIAENKNIYVGPKIVVTIAREYGSGGRYVGRLLADSLGVNFYDKELISLSAEKSGLSEKYIHESDEKMSGINDNDNRLFIAESKVINDLADKESCVIVGRCADYILKDNKDAIKIFLYSDDESKVNRAVKYYGMKENNALKEINKINKERAKHYSFYTNRDWHADSNYNLKINVDSLGVENCVKFIQEYIKENLKVTVEAKENN